MKNTDNSHLAILQQHRAALMPEPITVTITGPQCSGKTTLAKALFHFLAENGIKAEVRHPYHREPGKSLLSTVDAKRIDVLILDTEKR